MRQFTRKFLAVSCVVFGLFAVGAAGLVTTGCVTNGTTPNVLSANTFKPLLHGAVTYLVIQNKLTPDEATTVNAGIEKMQGNFSDLGIIASELLKRPEIASKLSPEKLLLIQQLANIFGVAGAVTLPTPTPTAQTTTTLVISP